MFCGGESNQAKGWIAVRLGDTLLQCPTNPLPSIRQAYSIRALSGRVIFLKTLKAMLRSLVRNFVPLGRAPFHGYFWSRINTYKMQIWMVATNIYKVCADTSPCNGHDTSTRNALGAKA